MSFFFLVGYLKMLEKLAWERVLKCFNLPFLACKECANGGSGLYTFSCLAEFNLGRSVQ